MSVWRNSSDIYDRELMCDWCLASAGVPLGWTPLMLIGAIVAIALNLTGTVGFHLPIDF